MIESFIWLSANNNVAVHTNKQTLFGGCQRTCCEVFRCRVYFVNVVCSQHVLAKTDNDIGWTHVTHAKQVVGRTVEQKKEAWVSVVALNFQSQLQKIDP